MSAGIVSRRGNPICQIPQEFASSSPEGVESAPDAAALRPIVIADLEELPPVLAAKLRKLILRTNSGNIQF